MRATHFLSAKQVRRNDAIIGRIVAPIDESSEIAG
jgi:hypothetical protein